MAIKSNLACALQKCLGNQWMQKHFSDITVEVEGTSFRCHKLILSACSGYFQSRFMKFPNIYINRRFKKNRVRLHAMTSNTFALILDAVYRGIDVLTNKNVFDIWAAAIELQIQYLIVECENFLLNNMSKTTCFVIYHYAKLHSSTNVLNSCFTFVQKHFMALRETDGFLKLSACDLYEVISNNNLTAGSENSVVDTVLKWVEYTPRDATTKVETQFEDRKQHMAKLFSAVRMYLVSTACLRYLSKHGLVLSCTDVCEKTFEAMNFNMCVESRHDAWPEAAVHRATSTKKHVMVFVHDNELVTFILNTGTFHKYAQLPESTMASITVFDNVLYLCTPTTLSMYTREHVWVNMIEDPPPKVTPRKRNILLSYGHYIYCYDPNSLSLKKCNCTYGHERNWKVCRTQQLSADSMIRFKRYILVFFSEEGKDTITTQCFDPVTGVCVLISPKNLMTQPSANMVSFTDQNDVFISHGNGKLWKIISTNSSLIDFEYVSELWPCEFEIYGAVVYQKQVFVFLSNDNTDSSEYNYEWPNCLPGIFEKINIVQMKSDTQCLPMVLCV